MEFDQDQKVREVISIFDEMNIKAAAEAMIIEYYKQSLDHLKHLNRPEERKEELYTFAEYLMNRKK